MTGKYINRHGVIIEVIEIDSFGQATYRFTRTGETKCTKVDSLKSMLKINGYVKID